MRLTRILGTVAAAAALALPTAPAQAVNTPAFTFTVDCETGFASTGSLGVTLPSGNYVVTVAGACSFADRPPASWVPVDTCIHPLGSLPCVSTGVTVSNVPRAVCMVGVGIVEAQACGDTARGVFQPLCDGYFTVKVDEQCLTTVPHTVGVIYHGGGAMTARVLDSTGDYWDNTGVFTVTAVWTPL